MEKTNAYKPPEHIFMNGECDIHKEKRFASNECNEVAMNTHMYIVQEENYDVI